MQTAELSRLTFDLPKGYVSVPIAADQINAPIRLGVVCRRESEPVGGPLVVLRETMDARVYLACLTDASGRVQQKERVATLHAEALQDLFREHHPGRVSDRRQLDLRHPDIRRRS